MAYQVVHKRGLYMNEAVPAGEGAMAAILRNGDAAFETSDRCNYSEW